MRHTEEEIQEVVSSLRTIETTIAGYMSAHQTHPVVEVVLNAVRARAEDTFVSARLQLVELHEAQDEIGC